jgi:hypothetical protein
VQASYLCDFITSQEQFGYLLYKQIAETLDFVILYMRNSEILKFEKRGMHIFEHVIIQLYFLKDSKVLKRTHLAEFIIRQDQILQLRAIRTKDGKHCEVIVG